MDEKNMMINYHQKVRYTVGDIKLRLDMGGYGDFVPEVAIVLGSGLGCFAESPEIEKLVEIPYEELPHFPKPTTEGHKGRLIFGAVGMLPIMIVDGRRHCYEFTDLNEGMKQVALPVRVMKGLGVEALITTNAVGGLDPRMNPGDLMVVQSVINNMGTNPLVGYNDEKFGVPFPPMNNLCDEELDQLFTSAFGTKMFEKLYAADQKLREDLSVNFHESIVHDRCRREWDKAKAKQPKLHEGNNVANLGRNYETTAEVLMFRKCGAHTAGMSLVPELWVAKHGHFEPKPENKGLDRILRTLAINAITNVVTDKGENKTSHEEVIQAGKKMEEYFPQIMIEFLKRYVSK